MVYGKKTRIRNHNRTFRRQICRHFQNGQKIWKRNPLDKWLQIYRHLVRRRTQRTNIDHIPLRSKIQRLDKLVFLNAWERIVKIYQRYPLQRRVRRGQTYFRRGFLQQRRSLYWLTQGFHETRRRHLHWYKWKKENRHLARQCAQQKMIFYTHNLILKINRYKIYIINVGE